MSNSDRERPAYKADRSQGISEQGMLPIFTSTGRAAHFVIWKYYVSALTLQTDEATAIHTEAEMQQASDAMREALKGDSAASAALTDMDVDAAQEMVYTLRI